MTTFSIIIPTYNRADLILITLKSVKKQLFKDYEVIVVDDGSTDNTKEVVKNFLNQDKNNNFRYLYKENGERGAARNFGIKHAKGTYITFLDSDDIIYPEHLEEAEKFIEHNINVNVFHQSYEILNYRKQIQKVNYPSDKRLNDAILKGNILSCFGVFLKKEIANTHLFDERRELSGSEDWLLWLKLSARYDVLFNNKITGCLIEHSGRSVLNFNEKELSFRTTLLKEKLIEDKEFVKKNGKQKVKHIYGHMLTYSALHLVMSGEKKRGLFYLFKGIFYNPKELFTKRTVAIIKKYFLNKIVS